MVAFDCTVLSLLLHPDAEVPHDPSTDEPIIRAADRMRFLVERLQEAGYRILIPAPALGEFLTVASPDYLTTINQSMWFEVGPFDQRAAIESAVALRRAKASGKGKKLSLHDDWQKIKVDRQIVAIAKVYEVTTIYTTDKSVIKLATESGLEAVHVANLPLPPERHEQMQLSSFSEPSEPSNVPEPPSGHSPDAEKE
jgi:predicted nucleic acid-binding protein